jgi:hypothetical protein
MKKLFLATRRRSQDGRRSTRPLTTCVFLSLLMAPAIVAQEPSLGRPTARVVHPATIATAADTLIASTEPGWPQWRGRRRDGISDETGLLERWPAEGPRRLWRFDELGKGWACPIVGGRRLYVAGDVEDDLVVFAFDTDGTLQWRTTNGKAWKGSFPGARSSCTFSEGRLYHMNAHGRLACLDAASGEELWADDILDRFDAKNITWALSESLLVDGPNVIVTPGGRKALVAALDKQSGQTVWSTEPLGQDQATHSSPILFRYAGRRLIANCSSAHGFGIDADSGRLLWTVPLKNQYGVNVATPVYGSGQVFYVTPYAEEGRAYDLLADRQGIVAKQIWTSSLDTVTGGALLVDGVLFAAGYRKSKWWFGLDWQSGRTKYELRDLTTGAAIYADGRLYVLDERGNVGLLKPGADGLEIVGQFRLVTDRVRDAWAHPVLHDGRLYLRYHDTLWCYDVKRG